MGGHRSPAREDRRRRDGQLQGAQRSQSRTVAPGPGGRLPAAPVLEWPADNPPTRPSRRRVLRQLPSATQGTGRCARRCEGSARQHPKQIVCTRRGTKQQEEPRRLQIADSRETAEQLVLDHAFAAELTAHESFTPQLCFASAGKNGPFRHADSTATTAFLPSASSHTSNLSHPSDYATLDSMAEATMRMGLSVTQHGMQAGRREATCSVDLDTLFGLSSRAGQHRGNANRYAPQRWAKEGFCSCAKSCT